MTMGRLIVVLLLAASPAHADQPAFHIAAPAGWQELTSLPPEALAGLPPAIVDQLERTHYELMAADVEHTSGGFTPSMNVIVNRASLRVTASNVRELGDQLMTQMQRGGMTARLVGSRAVRIEGVDTARFELEDAFSTTRMHQIIYMMPAGDRTAIVTFTASPEQYPGYQAVFDQTAAASRGLAVPAGFGWYEVVVAAVVGGIAAGFVGLLRKRNKSRQAA
jgi:hypothetical protein